MLIPSWLWLAGGCMAMELMFTLIVSFMKKSLFVLACLALLGACTRDDDAGGAKDGAGQGLTLLLGDDSVGMEVTGRMVAVFNLPKSTGHGTEAEWFTGSGPIVLEDGGTDGGVVLAVAGAAKDEVGQALRNDENGISVELRVYPTTTGWGTPIEEVFAGVLPVDGTTENGTVRMQRLAGGLMVDFAGVENVRIRSIEVTSPYYRPIALGEYELWPMNSNVEVSLNMGEMCYMWPIDGKVKGKVHAIHVDPETGGTLWETDYTFESTMEMEPNRVLYLTVEIPEAAESRSVGELTATVVGEELKEF